MKENLQYRQVKYTYDRTISNFIRQHCPLSPVPTGLDKTFSTIDWVGVVVVEPLPEGMGEGGAVLPSILFRRPPSRSLGKPTFHWVHFDVFLGCGINEENRNEIRKAFGFSEHPGFDRSDWRWTKNNGQHMRFDVDLGEGLT